MKRGEGEREGCRSIHCNNSKEAKRGAHMIAAVIEPNVTLDRASCPGLRVTG
jgi:hypothetical protein